MEQRLQDKIAIVTGAGQGIGKAVALRLAQEGSHITLADINLPNVEQVAQEIRAGDRQALPYQINLANIAEIQPMIAKTVETFGRIDILVNVAGIVRNTPFLEVTEAEWDIVININQKSVVFCTQAVAKQMIAQIPEHALDTDRTDQCYGKVVNFASISGRRGRAFQIHYAASKAAIISITQSCALALSRYGILVNAVSPGIVPTPMWEQNDRDKQRIFGTAPGEAMCQMIAQVPLKRAGSPEELAAVVTFLCSPDADYMTGQTLNVDGGFEMN